VELVLHVTQCIAIQDIKKSGIAYGPILASPAPSYYFMGKLRPLWVISKKFRPRA
jgi:hypothetical protein